MTTSPARRWAANPPRAERRARAPCRAPTATTQRVHSRRQAVGDPTTPWNTRTRFLVHTNPVVSSSSKRSPRLLTLVRAIWPVVSDALKTVRFPAR